MKVQQYMVIKQNIIHVQYLLLTIKMMKWSQVWNYGDEFLSQDVLKWYTRSNRTLESEEVKQIIDAKENQY